MSSRRAARLARAIRLVLALLAPVGALAEPVPAWPGDPIGRLEAQALLETLNGRLLAAHSATAVLQSWCAEHRLAAPPRIAATLLPGADRPADPAQRAALQAGAGEAIRHRRVALRCGATLLSVADNWYLPGRLTQEMNRLLETTDTPFGTVVRSLEPRRETRAVSRFWTPLPAGWEMAPGLPDPAVPLAIPEALFEHRAVLRDAGFRPIALVVETYQAGLFAFTPPR